MIIALVLALQDKIVFEQDWRVWSMNPDGTERREKGGRFQFEGRTSPDGTKRVDVMLSCGSFGLSIDGIEIEDDGALNPRWSADGARIVYEAGDEIWTMNADGTDRKKVAEGHMPQFLDDGRILRRVRAGQDGKLTLWSLKAGDETIVESAPILDVAVRGDRIAYSTPEGIHVGDRLLRYGDRFWAHGAHGLVWSPDGDAIACSIRFLGGREAGAEVIGDKEIYIVPLDGGEIRSIEVGDGATPISWEKP